MESIKQPPIIVVVGETASGKSSLALGLANKFSGEIICADSLSVYRGFDIGSAKPTREERRKIKHHLLDVADPVNGFSAPDFQRLALNTIEDITSRGKIPIMAGGSGLYIDSILFNYSFLPPADLSQRSQLNKMSLDALLQLAEKRNLPVGKIDIKNRRRVIRLIESNGQTPTRSGIRDNVLLIGLKPSREQLTENITNRVDRMINTGLEEEVRKLSKRYGWSVEPMKGAGYREWRCYFEYKCSLGDTKAKIIKSSIFLAKKQRTWFNNKKYNNSIHWLNNRSKIATIDDIITTFLSK